MKYFSFPTLVRSILVFSTAMLLSADAFTQNVGIGTAIPAGKLHIDLTGAATPYAVLIDDDSADNPTIRIRKGGISKGFAMIEGDDFKLGTYGTNPNGKLILETSSASRMYISPAGNIGIGIADPTSKFHINGGTEVSLTSNGYMMLGTDGGQNLVFDRNEIQARSDSAISDLFIQSEGGSTQFGKSSVQNIEIENATISAFYNGGPTHMYLQYGGGNVSIGDAGNINGSARLGVDGNAVVTGTLRVGSTFTPSGYKLAVDGKAIMTEVLVRLVPNWPDYVFSKNYKLPGLNEVEDFILKNNHLPGIPSAKTLESTGLNLGEMQKLQMEKIEELTLYIIELKKEIEKLKQQNK